MFVSRRSASVWALRGGLYWRTNLSDACSKEFHSLSRLDSQPLIDYPLWCGMNTHTHTHTSTHTQFWVCVCVVCAYRSEVCCCADATTCKPEMRLQQQLNMYSLTTTIDNANNYVWTHTYKHTHIHTFVRDLLTSLASASTIKFTINSH